MSLRSPLEMGLGQYMGQYYAQLVADTPFMEEFIARGLSKSIVWVPGRMIDEVDKMVEAWRQNDNKKDITDPDGAPGVSSRLPVVFVAMSKDFMPGMPDYSTAIGAPVDVTHPNDPDQRNLKVRVSANEYRAQIVFVAAELHSAHSLALQFNLWANGPGGRRFKHRHMFGALANDYPASLEQIDIGAVDAKAEQSNLTILIADLTIRAAIPIFQGPPEGYPLVQEVHTDNKISGTKSVAKLDNAGNPISEFIP
jgi:hypothetical protein